MLFLHGLCPRHSVLILAQGGKGLLKDTPVEDLLAAALKAVLDKSGIDPKLVEDVAVGSVLSPGEFTPDVRASTRTWV